MRLWQRQTAGLCNRIIIIIIFNVVQCKGSWINEWCSTLSIFIQTGSEKGLRWMVLARKQRFYTSNSFEREQLNTTSHKCMKILFSWSTIHINWSFIECTPEESFRNVKISLSVHWRMPNASTVNTNHYRKIVTMKCRQQRKTGPLELHASSLMCVMRVYCRKRVMQCMAACLPACV